MPLQRLQIKKTKKINNEDVTLKNGFKMYIMIIFFSKSTCFDAISITVVQDILIKDNNLCSKTKLDANQTV